ncbi:MAG TPA: 4-hydroxy-tetrahydrodipicolinate reductase [Geminicoccaceae bacterium]|jgi:4-hydroxy-tetrahydrodipicolinate reductase|nr:4-hydroxy-tetrahydrodipicolinate reductase [Geminicoccaceae bacterium]
MRIGVLGCAGRMGRAVVGEVLGAEGCTLAGGVEQGNHPALGQDLGTLAGQEPVGVIVSDDTAALIGASDAVIEFSAPDATAAHVALAAAHGTAHVIGTTGLSEAQEQAIRDAARRTAIMRAANMSLGVNLLLGLTEQVARALGPETFDIEILEMHHRHKVDAPSGTALALGRAAARGRAVDLAAVADRGRDGLTGARRPGAIGFAALRGGDVVGDHVVIFAGAGERIELAHRAADRRIYARGAVIAARWLRGRPPGLYGMADVLGLMGARP